MNLNSRVQVWVDTNPDGLTDKRMDRGQTNGQENCIPTLCHAKTGMTKKFEKNIDTYLMCCIASDKVLFSAKKSGHFSYFCTEIYIVGTH